MFNEAEAETLSTADKELPSKIEELDMLRVTLKERELENARLKAEMRMTELQTAIDQVWIKYEMRKGLDQIKEDGTIVRGNN